MTHHIPFQERKTPWRAVLDVASGCYPGFVWGGPPGEVLPVFHFHDVVLVLYLVFAEIASGLASSSNV